MGVEIRVEGTEQWHAAARNLMERARHVTDGAMDDALATVERAAQANLTRYSHPAGTPTTSPPGQPPALVSGALRRSIKTRRTKHGPNVYAGGVGPTIVYGPIQERGGTILPKRGPFLWWRTGDGMRRARSVTLPPRPFLRPAARDSIPRIRRIFADAWTRAIKG